MSDTARCELPSLADLVADRFNGIEKQARSLCELRAGWDFADAPIIDSDAVRNAMRLAVLVTCPECLAPVLTPTVHGQVIVDWTWGEERVEVEVSASGALDVLVRTVDGFEELSMSLDEPDDLSKLAHLVTGVGIRRFEFKAA